MSFGNLNPNNNHSDLHLSAVLGITQKHSRLGIVAQLDGGFTVEYLVSSSGLFKYYNQLKL